MDQDEPSHLDLCCLQRQLFFLFSALTFQTTKFSFANFHKNVKSKLYHIENSMTRK